MRIERYYKKPVFEYQEYHENYYLSKGARKLLALLNKYRKEEKYNLIDGFIPLDYREIQADLRCSIEEIKNYFRELERYDLVSRCVARFICIKENVGVK